MTTNRTTEQRGISGRALCSLAFTGSLLAGACSDAQQRDQRGSPENDRALSCTKTTLSGDDYLAALEYYGTNAPSYLPPIPEGYEICAPNVQLNGGLHGLNHQPTNAEGAGKFVFNRIYRSTKNGLDFGEQFGIFHWWLSSYGNNSLEGGVWNNPFVAGPHYYPTLHLAGIGDTYHLCNDVQSGHGLYDVDLGDRWLTMIQISNQLLSIPGVNIAFDKEQPPYDDDHACPVSEIVKRS